MTNSRDFEKFRMMGDKILFEGVSWRDAVLGFSTREPLAAAIISYMSYRHLKPKTIDDTLIAKSGDKLEFICRNEGLRYAEFKLEQDWHKKDNGSFIGYIIKDGIEVPVLLQNKLKGYVATLPLENVQLQVTDNNVSSFGDRAIFLYKDITSFKHPYLWFFISALRENRSDILGYLLAMLFVCIVTLIIPAATYLFVDTLIPARDISMVTAYTVVILAIIIAGFLANLVSNRLKLRIQTRVSSEIFLAVWDKILRMGSSSVRKIGGSLSGALTQLQTSLSTIIDAILTFLMNVILCIVTYIQARNYGRDYDNMIHILVIVIIVINVILGYLFAKMTINDKRNSVSLMKYRSELLNGIETIKNNAAEDMFYYRYAIAYDKNIRSTVSCNALTRNISITTTMLYGIGIFLLFPTMISGGITSLNIKTFSSFSSGFMLFSGYLGMMIQAVMQLITSLSQGEILKWIIKEPSEEQEGTFDVGEITGAIELRDVSFRYTSEQNYVINGINLRIKPGEYIGIVGGSGCGKSTLLRLLMGFEKPEEGKVLYDSYDIAECDKRILRKQFGVVLQDAMLSGGSIKKNISQEDEPDMEMVREAARKAAILDDIEQMPMKFETVINESSEVVSGGQRQRILLARALMKEPKVMFLDEATSALDNKSQETVENSLDSLNITRIVVAHRLSTIRNCDRILVMDNGVIAEQGTYDELIEKGGLFLKLAKRNMI